MTIKNLHLSTDEIKAILLELTHPGMNKQQIRLPFKRQPFQNGPFSGSGRVKFEDLTGDTARFRMKRDVLPFEIFSEVKAPALVGDLLSIQEPITCFGQGTHYPFVWYPAGGNNTPELTSEFPDQDPNAPWHSEQGPGGRDVYQVPSEQMPSWASRLTLKVLDVRIQRLQDISIEDAVAEGFRPIFDKEKPVQLKTPNGSSLEAYPYRNPIDRYREFWDSRWPDPFPWDRNPWVAALTFKPVFKNVDDMGAET